MNHCDAFVLWMLRLIRWLIEIPRIINAARETGDSNSAVHLRTAVGASTRPLNF
jgi:hypothetical protein